MLAWSFLAAKAKSRIIISSHYLIKRDFTFFPPLPLLIKKINLHQPLTPPPKLGKDSKTRVA